jgi:hypothetical protein
MVEKLPYNFHDAGLADVTPGPRREVLLAVNLDDLDFPSHFDVNVSFGGISNYPEVKRFLERVPPTAFPGAYRERIDFLDYDKN